jgi:uncharacterized protein (DUF1015 family)
MRIRTFQGLSPAPEHAAAVAAVPYDVVNRDEAAALAEGNPHSLLHVDRAEIDLDPDIDPYSPEVYAQARAAFLRMQEQGVLRREAQPCMYLYRQTAGGHSQTGLVTVCHVDDYANDVIKKHEKTRPDKEKDRTTLVDTLGANTGPIFLTYRDRASVAAITRSEVEGAQPLYDVTAPDGVRHQVWRVSRAGSVSLGAIFADEVDAAYVADGHHRAASAFNVARLRREACPDATGEENFNWFLCVLFPAGELRVLPYNRVVKDLNCMDREQFLARAGEVFEMRPVDDKEPPAPGGCRMYLKGQWYALEWGAPADASPIDQLDVSILQDRLLAPVLGIDDPRTSKRVDFIGGIRGTEELERLVDSRQFAVAFSMHPVTVEQLMAISDAGQIMPPKSTWFEPKLRSGFFIHTLDG